MTLIVVFLSIVISFAIVGLGAAGWCQLLAKYLFSIELEEYIKEKVSMYAWLGWIIYFFVVIYSVIIDKPIYSSFWDYVVSQIYVVIFGLFGAIYYTKNNP